MLITWVHNSVQKQKYTFKSNDVLPNYLLFDGDTSVDHGSLLWIWNIPADIMCIVAPDCKFMVTLVRIRFIPTYSHTYKGFVSVFGPINTRGNKKIYKAGAAS